MMICEKCGKKTNGKNGKCESCGHPVIWESAGKFLMRPDSESFKNDDGGCLSKVSKSDLPSRKVLVIILVVAVVVAFFVGWFANSLIMRDGRSADGDCVAGDERNIGDNNDESFFSDADNNDNKSEINKKTDKKSDIEYLLETKLKEFDAELISDKGKEDGYYLLAKNTDDGLSFGVFKTDDETDGELIAQFGSLKTLDEQFTFKKSDDSVFVGDDESSSKDKLKNAGALTELAVKNSDYIGEGVFAVSYISEPNREDEWITFGSDCYIICEKNVCSFDNEVMISEFEDGYAIVCEKSNDGNMNCMSLSVYGEKSTSSVMVASHMDIVARNEDIIVINGKDYNIGTLEPYEVGSADESYN